MPNNDPSQPLRLKREIFCLYLANNYGVSASYASAEYSFKSREHLSKNAATLAADAAIQTRVEWLKEHPQKAVRLLEEYVSQRDENDAQRRSKTLSEAIAKRKAANVRRALPLASEAPGGEADETTLLELLHHCQNEAKAIYERAKLERADPMIIKHALGHHRDFTVTLQKYRGDAKQAGKKSTSAESAVSALDVYAGMCVAVDEAPPKLSEDDVPIFASIEESDISHDESELQYNVTQTLNQYDLLLETTNRPDMRVQLQLLEALGKSTQRLISLQSQRRERGKYYNRSQPTTFEIDPGVVVRWTKQHEIA